MNHKVSNYVLLAAHEVLVEQREKYKEWLEDSNPSNSWFNDYGQRIEELTTAISILEKYKGKM